SNANGTANLSQAVIVADAASIPMLDTRVLVLLLVALAVVAIRSMPWPAEKHWYGAAATTGMTHIAILESLNGKNVDLTDEENAPGISNSRRSEAKTIGWEAGIRTPIRAS